MELEVNNNILNSVKKLTPAALQAFNLLLFFKFIPDDIAERFDILFAIVGGVITLILSFWMVFSLLPILFEKIPIISGILCISTLFIFGIFFLLKTTNFSSDELRKYGTLTNAQIIDKSKYYNHKGHSIQSMEVKFISLEMKSCNATITLSEREYDDFEEGMIIPIYYSSKHPNIARIAYDKRKH